MEFYEVVRQVAKLLQEQGRVTYRGLKLQFKLDDETLEALKDELLFSHPVVDEAGRGLVWTGEAGTKPEPVSTQPVQPEVTEQDQLIQAEPPPIEPHTPDAERRQLTVMFCDLVGSTTLSGQLDPEDYREVVRSYQATCSEVIKRYDGHVAQLLGDGLLVYFGSPQAHEDDAQRAVRTGLGIVEAIGTLNTRLEQDKGIKLAVRLGIHTGLVVVGAMGGAGRQEQLALGEVPNVASRIQGWAEPDTVVISNTTYQLVEGYFHCDDLGAHTLKGVATPMQTYQVRQATGSQSRIEVVAVRGLTPLVGREDEAALLQRRWEQSKAGSGQVVLLSGEAGIGKSRLVEVVRQQVVSDGMPRIVFRCSPYHINSALYPVIEHVQRLVHLQHDDPPEVKLDKLEQALRMYGFPLDEMVPLLAPLLSVPLLERYPPPTVAPQRQRQQTFDTLVAWLLKEAERQPVLVVWEDLHWTDPSTLELLSLLLDQVPTARMLTLLAFRPDFHPPWAMAAHLTHLPLNRFTPQQVERMALHVAGGKLLPAEVIEQVVTQTDGVPLFVEELTKTVLESEVLVDSADHYALSGPLPALSIPATLHDALMARLDRLETAKGIAQLGATIGRQFSYEVFQAISPLEEATLQRELERLVEADLLSQRGVLPHATYTFKHVLIQGAAYQSLLRSTRQQHHRQIAQMLEERFPETVETQPELLAHHYTEAGLNAQALPYWQQAGQRALGRSAHAEAVAHLTRGLEVLKTLPATTEHTQQELALQTLLGPALMAAKGQATVEVERVYTRARELCRQVGETPQLFPALGGLHRFYFARGALQTARELGEQFLRLAQRQHDSALLLAGHWMLATPLLWLGEVAAAHEHLKQSSALYDPQQHRALTFRYGLDPGSACRVYTAFALWTLGYPDQALTRSHEALTLAQELSHPFSLAYVLMVAAWIRLFRREAQVSLERSETLITLSNEKGFPVWLAYGTMLRGWALALLGQENEGMAQMRQSLAALQTTEVEVNRPYFLALLTETYGKVGQAEEGLRLLVEALTPVNTTHERWSEAERHRLKGELLLSQSVPDERQAETCFHRALDIARHQQAKSLELRAATSLARLWQSQDKRQEAHDLLAPVYGWFTEGFDTADLQDAKALLDALA